MLRSFTPFLLASLGFILFVLALMMPLLEWQISETVVGVSSSCKGTLPSSLTTSIGESLDLKDSPFLAENLRFVVRSSQSGRVIEGITRNISQRIIPLLWLLMFLCGIYIGWYAIYNKRTIAEVLVSPLVAMILLCALINAGRLFNLDPYFFLLCLRGAFNAELSKIHYETLLVLLAAMLAAVGAVIVMLIQIRHAIIQSEESSKSAVD